MNTPEHTSDMTKTDIGQTSNEQDGQLIKGITGGDDGGLHYQLYLPQALDPSRPVLTAVHGISRNPDDWMKLFRKVADEQGTALLAPLFDQARFGDFQRLGRHGRGQRADHALISVLDRLDELYGIQSKMALFGFSGGAQFAHRFSMVHGARVSSLVLGASGWYTWPDPDTAFPYGTRPVGSLPGVNFDFETLLRIPTRVLVGSDDVVRDQSLNCRKRIDKVQGKTRRERAENWVSAMRSLARERNLPDLMDLQFLPDTGHYVLDQDGGDFLRKLACDWFFNH